MGREKVYIEYITGEIYKMLVLREKDDNGEEVYLSQYIENLYVEINGAYIWSDYLKSSKNYAAVTSIIAYLSENDIEYQHYRREVFKMLGLLNKISKELGGDA